MASPRLGRGDFSDVSDSKKSRKGHNGRRKQISAACDQQYQGKPIIRIPTVENPNPDTTWHWLSFGKNKAKTIVKYYDAIKKFAEE